MQQLAQNEIALEFYYSEILILAIDVEARILYFWNQEN